MTAPRNGREILRGKLKTVHSLQPSKLKLLKTLSVADGVFNDVTLRHSKRIIKVANVAFLRTLQRDQPNFGQTLFVHHSMRERRNIL